MKSKLLLLLRRKDVTSAVLGRAVVGKAVLP